MSPGWVGLIKCIYYKSVTQSEKDRLRDGGCLVKERFLPLQLLYLGWMHTETCAKSLIETRHMAHEEWGFHRTAPEGNTEGVTKARRRRRQKRTRRTWMDKLLTITGLQWQQLIPSVCIWDLCPLVRRLLLTDKRKTNITLNWDNSSLRHLRKSRSAWHLIDLA